MPANVTLQCYKIAQEAISNAIKHGKATHLAISVCRNSDRLVLTVKNDGVPFSPPANPKNRMGLRIMNYRANTIGAEFEIKPNHKNGTIVMCALPMRNGHGANVSRVDLDPETSLSSNHLNRERDAASESCASLAESA